MISIRLRNNQGKDNDAKQFFAIHLIRVFCPTQVKSSAKAT